MQKYVHTFARFVPAFVLLVAAAVLVSSSSIGAQSYSSGQNISPAFEGWEENADGTFFLFGYMNRNWQEEIDVPVGPDNTIEPGGPDHGQPTHFLPRRNRFIFKVRVPKGFTEKDEMIWTLTTKGRTEKAYATLRTDYKVDDVVKASETGSLGAGTSSPEVRSNKAPVVKIEGDLRRTVKVGEPLSLAVIVTDDGIPQRRGQGGAPTGDAARGRGRGDAAATPATPNAPQRGGPGAPFPTGTNRNPAYNPPSRITVGKTNGLHMGWFVYRGSGKVTFDPPQVEIWEDTRASANSPWAPLWTPPALPADGRWTARVTFAAPGTYVLRARADDGALTDDQQLTVVVSR